MTMECTPWALPMQATLGQKLIAETWLFGGGPIWQPSYEHKIKDFMFSYGGDIYIYIYNSVDCQYLSMGQPNCIWISTMNMEIRPLVIEGPLKFDKWPVEVQDFKKIVHHFIGIHRIYPNFIKKNRKMTTCNGWIGKLWDLDRFCPKSSSNTWVIHEVPQREAKPWL